MPQPHALDDLGVFEIPEKIHEEKVLCRDLAAFLGVSKRAVSDYAKERNCWHWFYEKSGGIKVGYVSPFIAARVIVFIRAQQEAKREAKLKGLRRSGAA